MRQHRQAGGPGQPRIETDIDRPHQRRDVGLALGEAMQDRRLAAVAVPDVTRDEARRVADHVAVARQVDGLRPRRRACRARPCSRSSRRPAAPRSRSTSPSRDRRKTAHPARAARTPCGSRYGRAWRSPPAPSRRPRSPRHGRARGRARNRCRCRHRAAWSRRYAAAVPAGAAPRHRSAAPVAALTAAAPGEWSRWVWVTTMWVTVSPRTASSSAAMCCSSSGPGIDDRDLAAADDVAQRALEGERARIVAQDAPHAGHDLLDHAGREVEGSVEGDVVGHGSWDYAVVRGPSYRTKLGSFRKGAHTRSCISRFFAAAEGRSNGTKKPSHVTRTGRPETKHICDLGEHAAAMTN